MRTARLLVIVLALIAPGIGYAEDRAIGDSRVVAKLPAAPGYPEGIVIDGNTVTVTTQARFASSIVPPLGLPEIQSFDRTTGALTKRVAIADADPTMDHGLSGLAYDGAGRLYVLDTQWGVLRLDLNSAPAVVDPASDPSVIYATAFPNLPPCTPLTPTPCAPTVADTPSLPNDIAFAPNGDAYVTDSLQATLWRIPNGGGAPQILFQDARIGGGFGPNGLRLDPARAHLVFAVTADALARGVIYRLPLANPSAEHLQIVHEYLLAEAPDNLAFGASGRLYVALAGTNQIGVLAADGTEVARYSGPAKGDHGAVLYDMPSGVALDPATRTLLANNHSEVLGLPQHFVVFDVYVDDVPDPLETPAVA
jgi:sugar lactone lactonase YvrE